ncbi:MAG: NADH-quinone oxidoreductase subunit NuoE [Thermodesulfobacteriota bacterium]
MLSEKVKKEIEGSLKKYPTPRSAVMDALRVAQEERGHLTGEEMREIAGILGMEPVRVQAMGGFYSMYNVEKPVGRNHVQICRNISCSLLGAEHLISHMEKLLDIKTGETTGDKKFTLSTVECLGSCGTAPMMQVNDDYHENLTEEKIEKILKGCK